MRLSGRARLDDKTTDSILWLADRGFSGKLIAAQCDVSPSVVYRTCAKEGRSVKTYRNGENTVAQEVIRANPAVAMRVVRRRRAG